MLGGIYSEQKCPICGGNFRDDGKKALACPKHNSQKATRFKVIFKKVHQRFNSYAEASRFLTGLRFEYDKGSFDARDYKKNVPLGFANLMEEWFENKKAKIKPGTIKNYRRYKELASDYFGNINIKELDYGNLEDFFNSLSVGNKTKHNLRSALHDFFQWVWKRNRKTFSLNDFPEFPEIKYSMGYRKIVSKEVQGQICEEVRRISYEINSKIYLGIKWLCTYPKVRPGELIKLREGNIDLQLGYLYFTDTKENERKNVKLTPEDIKILNTFPRAMPDMHFFRHGKGLKGTKENEPFGPRLLYKYWKKACTNLGIEGVDLYGGTKHSTVTALKKKNYSSEDIKKYASGHKTNKAFQRYLQDDDAISEQMYVDAIPGKDLAKHFAIV